jgi:methylated-DNA-[protein]-cysteine S-methyltransferase
VERRFPGAAPAPATPDAERAIEGIVALFRGEKRDMREIVLDLEGVPDFNRRVYELARTIPPGATLTYGDVATRLGTPGMARAVGHALGQNPWPIVVPCHRVLAADGGMGGFSAPCGVSTKRKMLEIEGVEGVQAAPRLF